MTNISIPQQEKQTDAARGKVIGGYDPDVDYEPKKSGPEIKAVNKDEENYDAQYAKIKLSRHDNAPEDNELQSDGKD